MYSNCCTYFGKVWYYLLAILIWEDFMSTYKGVERICAECGTKCNIPDDMGMDHSRDYICLHCMLDLLDGGDEEDGKE